MTKPECLARIIQNNMSKRDYQRHRNDGIERNANIYLPYKEVMAFRDQYCMPKPIKDCIISKEVLICPMQDATHHQLGKLFSVVQPTLKNEMEEIIEVHPKAKFDVR